MGQSEDVTEEWEVVSRSRWTGFELEVPNFNITRVKERSMETC